MPPVTRAALKKQIAAGDTAPLYVLVGDDDTEKSAVAAEFAEMVDEGLRAFSVDRLFGAEIKADDLFDAAATLPMMAPKRIVIVFDAEKILIPKREGKAADAEQERLEAFFRNPPAHATVVLACGAVDQRRRLIKLLLKEVAQVVDCGTIENPEDAARWVKARAERDRVPLDASAVRALVERAGVDIVRLRSGLERVALYALGQPKITADDVKQVVLQTAEAAEWGISDAIRQNDAPTALRELALALDGGAPPFFVLGQLRTAAERMPPPRLKKAIDAVFRTDVALKSSGGDPKVLLERLVVELCSSSSSRPASRTWNPRPARP